jgi:hypothetical protein
LGGVWHDPQVAIPNCTQSATGGEETCTNMYLCVLNGCPEKGATEMRCKDGNEDSSPLCSICEKGFFKHNQDCVECEEPRWGLIVLVFLTTVVMCATVYHYVKTYQRYLRKTVIFAHVKVGILSRVLSIT